MLDHDLKTNADPSFSVLKILEKISCVRSPVKPLMTSSFPTLLCSSLRFAVL